MWDKAKEMIEDIWDFIVIAFLTLTTIMGLLFGTILLCAIPGLVIAIPVVIVVLALKLIGG